MRFLVRVILVILSLSRSFKAVVIENYSEIEPRLVLYKEFGGQTEILGVDCSAGVYLPKHQRYTCACFTGLWAFYQSWCTAPFSIIAGDNYCITLPDEKISQAGLLSSINKTFGPTIVHMTAKHEQMLEKHDHDADVTWDPAKSTFITIGDASWELETIEGKTHCLEHSLPNDVCHFLPFNGRTIMKIRRGCNKTSHIMTPDVCSEVRKGSIKSEPECLLENKPSDTSKMISELLLLQQKIHGNRIKRATPTDSKVNSPTQTKKTSTTPTDPNTATEVEDEDFVDPAQAAVKNNPIILDQLKNYMDSKINSVTGASGQFLSDKRFPAFELLELTKRVMSATCSVVSPTYLEMALNAFINIQTNSLHVREPYVEEKSFNRIKDALVECIREARPYAFRRDLSPELTAPGAVPPGQSTTAALTECGDEIPPNATHIVSQGDMMFNISVPDEIKGSGFEPIIEVVWKTVLNAHSYCYRQFSEYYNDHHTFTVTLLPFFTNEIQNLWFGSGKNGTYEEPPDKTFLYGGIIGDHRSLLINVDLCVAASRLGSPYPWFMSRPPVDSTNKWNRRRKRSTMVSHGEICLTSPSDIYDKIYHQRCE